MQRHKRIRATLRSDPQRLMVTIARAERTKKTFPARLHFFKKVPINDNTRYGVRVSVVYLFMINRKIKPMNKFEKEVNANQVMMMMVNDPQIRVSDVASKLYLNKDKARRLLDWMVREGYIKKRTIRYVGNANLNVYTR